MSEAPITVASKEVAPKPGGKVVPTTSPPTQVQSPPKPTWGSTQPISANTTGPTDTIVVSIMVMMGSALIKDVAAGKPSAVPIVSGMALGTVLLIIATFAPTLARMLAITGMVGALMTNGGALLKIGSVI